jgi:hypothetical protein
MSRLVVFLCLLGGAAGAGPLEEAVLTAELSRHYDGETLAKAATSEDAADRRAAAQCAGRLKDPRTLPWLLPLVDDPVAPVRRSAIFALGQIGAAEVVVPLRGALPRHQPADLPFALEALGKTKDPRVVSDVARYLRHEDADVRGRAALALARAGDFGATQDVFAALTTESVPEVRWRLVYAMWMLIRERARRDGKAVATPAEWTAILREAAAADRPFDERVFALRGLGQIDGQRAFLAERFGDPDPRIVVEALRTTAKPFDRETAKRAAGVAANPDVLVREEVLEHLAAGGAEAAEFLEVARPWFHADLRLFARAQVVIVAAGGLAQALPADSSEDLREETCGAVRHTPRPPPSPRPCAGRSPRPRRAGRRACRSRRPWRSSSICSRRRTSPCARRRSCPSPRAARRSRSRRSSPPPAPRRRWTSGSRPRPRFP